MAQILPTKPRLGDPFFRFPKTSALMDEYFNSTIWKVAVGCMISEKIRGEILCSVLFRVIKFTDVYNMRMRIKKINGIKVVDIERIVMSNRFRKVAEYMYHYFNNAMNGLEPNAITDIADEYRDILEVKDTKIDHDALLRETMKLLAVIETDEKGILLNELRFYDASKKLGRELNRDQLERIVYINDLIMTRLAVQQREKLEETKQNNEVTKN